MEALRSIYSYMTGATPTPTPTPAPQSPQIAVDISQKVQEAFSSKDPVAQLDRLISDCKSVDDSKKLALHIATSNKVNILWVSTFLEARLTKLHFDKPDLVDILMAGIIRSRIIEVQSQAEPMHLMVNTKKLFGRGSHTDNIVKISAAFISAFRKFLEVITQTPDSKIYVEIGQFVECRFSPKSVRPFLDCFDNLPGLVGLNMVDITGTFSSDDQAKLVQLVDTNPALTSVEIQDPIEELVNKLEAKRKK
jgi:hypothetical protein